MCMKKSNIVHIKLTIFRIDFLPRFDNMYKCIPITLIRSGVIIINHVRICLYIQLNPYLMKCNCLVVNKSEFKTSTLSDTDMSKQVLIN